MLKQSAPRYRQSHRYQSTTTESTPSSTTDSGFAVESGALGRRQGEPLKDGSLLNANAHDQPPSTQQTAEASSKNGKGGEADAGIKDRKARGAKQKTKAKKAGKNNHKGAAALDATTSTADLTQHAVDNGEASYAEKPGTASTPQPTAAKNKQGRRRKAADRKKKGNAGQGAVRAKPSDNTSEEIPTRIRRIEDREEAQSSKQSEAVSAQVTEGLIEKNDKDQSSSTPDQIPLTRRIKSTRPAPAAKSITKQIVVKRGIRSIRRAAQLLGRANGEKRKAWEQKGLRVEQARSELKKSLESSVEAQKETLKAKDKAEKTIEAKAKRPRKVGAFPTR